MVSHSPAMCKGFELLRAVAATSQELAAMVQIEISHLPGYLRGRCHTRDVCGDMESMKRLAETQAIIATLKRNHYKRLTTARDLGIHKTTPYRKMKSL